MSDDPAMDLLERVLDAPPTISLQAIEALLLTEDGSVSEPAPGGPITVTRVRSKYGPLAVNWPGIRDTPDRPGVSGNTYHARSPSRALHYVERFAKQAASHPKETP